MTNYIDSIDILSNNLSEINLEIVPIFKEIIKPKKIRNNGTGAGGAQTTKNGNNYEELTDFENLIKDDYPIKSIQFGNGKNSKYAMFVINNINFELVKQNGMNARLYKEFNQEYNKNLKPDECIIDTTRKILFILEKKFQQCDGSVDEKIQTGYMKRKIYKKLYPNYNIEYMYVLSDWFKQKKYKLDISLNREENIHMTFGSDINYKNIIIDWISSPIKDL